MTVLTEPAARADLLNRLRRAEGQLRGVQRMIEEGSDCLLIAGQLNAVCHVSQWRHGAVPECLHRDSTQQYLSPPVG